MKLHLNPCAISLEAGDMGESHGAGTASSWIFPRVPLLGKYFRGLQNTLGNRGLWGKRHSVVCVCVCVHMNECAGARGPVGSLRRHFSGAFHLLFQAGSVAVPELTEWARLSCQWAPGSTYLCFPGTGVADNVPLDPHLCGSR